MKVFVAVNTRLITFILLLLLPLLGNAAPVVLETYSDLFNTQLMIIWLSMCSVLVLFLSAGFLLRELGMVGAKNTVNVAMKSFAGLGLGSMGYWLLGSGLMLGANTTGWLGTSDFLPTPITTLNSVNLLYQLMFAVIAASIVSGAVAERFNFLPYVVGAFVISSVIYPVYGSWAWGGSANTLGWLRALGFHDAAGATVVHSMGGWCALGALIVVGPRQGRFSRKGTIHNIPGHNLPLLALGGFVLWFAWFGFVGGAVNDDFSNLGSILLNTHLGAIGGICGAIAYMGFSGKGFYMARLVNGVLAGLVAISAGCNVFGPHAALLVGTLAGVIACTGAELLERFNIDDVVGAVPVHAFAGAWGTLAVGLFYQGDMFSLERIIAQVVGIIVAFVWGVSMSYGLFLLLNKVAFVRVSARVEERGLDASEHLETGYSDFMITRTRADS